jgi:hypothetical protein
MSLIEVVTRYSEGRDGLRPVVVLADAEALAGSLATPDTDASGRRADGRVVVDLAAEGDEAAVVERVAPSLQEHDVLVLVLTSPPETIPAGPFVQTICAHGLRVVQTEGLPKRHARTVVVLTGDRSVPQRSYLLGEDLPDSDATRLRQANEWAVEGLQLRALSARSEAALAGAREELAGLRAERDTLKAKLAAESKRLQEQAVSLAAATKQLRTDNERRVSRRVRRAAKLLRDDPVGGSKRLARAAGRRLGR